jgi:hypothetical protein
MALIDTNLLILMAPIPPTFRGSPQQLSAEMIRRMKIVSGSGSSFFVISDVEPSSNVGPWLKGGTQWFVFSNETNRYVPLDISASETRWFHMQNSTPSSSVPAVWLRTERDQTTTDLSFGRALGWYEWTGSAWRPFNSIIASGTTAQRPSNPVEYEEYYDTDIACRIWFERGQWRTVDGVPGDIKQVAFEVLTDALEHNPGWSVLGSANQAFRGRHLVQATKDSGATPATNLTTGAGVASRAAFETWFTGVTAGATDVVPAISFWTLVKE